MEKRKRLTSMVFLAGLLALSVVTHAGSLEPSAPPGPTMKTLDEVEPRVPIRASDLPLTIAEPNSYYLVEDVGFVSTATAITIECNDVTIDLMGYTLKGPDSGTGSGIYMNGRSNVEVCNGTVRDFYRGIREQSSSGEQHRVINVRVMSNEYGGIFLMGYGHLVKDCTAQENGYYGIYAKYGSTVTGNTCYDNGYDGIYAPYGCTVTGNTAYENGLSGIYAYTGCTVTGNTVSYNTVDGIKVDQDCTVSDNTCWNNGNAGDGAGIHATGQRNRIERNHVTANNRGIDVDVSLNLIVKNSASGGTEYDIAAGNKVGPIVTDVNSTTSPWANFDF